MKSNIFYKISFGYGLVCLAFSLLYIPGVIMLYRAQGISSAYLIDVISTNTFSANFIWFVTTTKDIFFSVLIVFVSLSLIRGKAVMNRMTDVAACIFSISACFSIVIIIAGICSVMITPSLQETLVTLYQVKYFAYPLLPIAYLVAVVLFTVSYVNEKFDASPRRYSQIIFPSLALLIVLLSSIVRLFHLH
jgi:hypothetical protein